jgi:hypothetical protein
MANDICSKSWLVVFQASKLKIPATPIVPITTPTRIDFRLFAVIAARSFSSKPALVAESAAEESSSCRGSAAKASLPSEEN